MEIKNHILQGIEYKKSPNVGGEIIPKYGIVHFTASSTASGAISWMLSPQSKVSAHLHQDRNGVLLQLVPFNIRANHAGVSTWRGIEGMNSNSIGIEVQNTGSQEYTDAQMKGLIEVFKLLVKQYGLKEIIGHEDVSPLRKNDPSGTNVNLFDWVMLYEGVGLPKKLYKTSADLNLRRGQGTNFPIIKKIEKSTEIFELNRIGEWSKIQIKGSKQSGWCNNKYLV